MKGLAGVAVCLVGFLGILYCVGRAFDTAAREPALAMEMAKAHAETDAAKAEATRTNVLLDKVQRELKASNDTIEGLRKRIAELETRPAPGK